MLEKEVNIRIYIQLYKNQNKYFTCIKRTIIECINENENCLKNHRMFKYGNGFVIYLKFDNSIKWRLFKSKLSKLNLIGDYTSKFEIFLVEYLDPDFDFESIKN